MNMNFKYLCQHPSHPHHPAQDIDLNFLQTHHLQLQQRQLSDLSGRSGKFSKLLLDQADLQSCMLNSLAQVSSVLRCSMDMRL